MNGKRMVCDACGEEACARGDLMCSQWRTAGVRLAAEEGSSPTLGNTQRAPWPRELAELVEELRGRPGYTFTLEDIDRGQGSEGLTFIISSLEPDTYNHTIQRGVLHYFPVPPAAYDARSWRRWLLDRCLDVAAHEVCEFFVIDGLRPYAPSHGPGNDPYLIREIGTDLDQRTSFRGEVKP